MTIADRVGLPLYDAMLAALDAAATEAESTLAAVDQIEDKELALRLCVQIARGFDVGQPLAAIGDRALRRGLNLFRTIRRGAAQRRLEVGQVTAADDDKARL